MLTSWLCVHIIIGLFDFFFLFHSFIVWYGIVLYSIFIRLVQFGLVWFVQFQFSSVQRKTCMYTQFSNSVLLRRLHISNPFHLYTIRTFIKRTNERTKHTHNIPTPCEVVVTVLLLVRPLDSPATAALAWL